MPTSSGLGNRSRGGALGVGLIGGLGSIPLVGLAVPVATIFALLLVPLKRLAPLRRDTVAVVVSAIVGAGALALSAAVNSVPLAPTIFGQFLVVAIYALAYTKVVTSLRLAALLTGWLSVSMLLYVFVFRPPNTQGGFEALWKFGIAYPATILLLSILAKRAVIWSVLALVALAPLGTVWGFRSYGLVCVVALVLTITKGKSGRSLALSLIGGGALLLLTAIALPRALSSGFFGADIQAKTAYQEEIGPLLLGGRTEPPLSAAAISDRPILGWGSAQSIGTDVLESGVRIAQAIGMGEPSEYLRYWIREDGYVSIHSMLFSSWVEGGVLAVVMPAVLVFIFLRAAATARGPYAALVTFVCTMSVWDLLFSPWTGNRGVQMATYALLAAMAIASRRAIEVSGVGSQVVGRDGVRHNSPSEAPPAAAQRTKPVATATVRQ